jgi:hypothetical protein
VISGRIIFTGRGSSGNSSKIASSTSSIQVSTLRGGGSKTKFTMAGQDSTIRLPKFQGDGSNDLKNDFFIYEKIWAAKKITDDYTKVVQLETTLREHELDWYMGLVENNPMGEPTNVA